MNGRGRRLKGHNYEREVARLFRDAFPSWHVVRGLQYRGGDEAPDVLAGPFAIECKRGKQPSPRAALAQAKKYCPEGKIPVAIVRDDRAEAFVVMGLGDFVRVNQVRFGKEVG